MRATGEGKPAPGSESLGTDLPNRGDSRNFPEVFFCQLVRRIYVKYVQRVIPESLRLA